MLRPCQKCGSKFGCKKGDGKQYCLHCGREVEAEQLKSAASKPVNSTAKDSRFKTPIGVKEIPYLIETLSGKAPSWDSVKRWIRDGYRGVRLRVAGPLHFRFTCQEWVEEFMIACGNVGRAERKFAEQAEKRTEQEEAAYEILEREFGIGKGRRK